MTSLELEQLAATIRDSPALAAKRDLALLTRLGAPLDGDDGAAIPHGDGYLIVCGEAIHPAFVRENPHAAGAAAVVTNVSDVRAMGGRPVGLVDMLVSPDRGHAEAVLDGLAWAAGLLGVDVVGGHLTLGYEPALSASCTGVARRPLRAGNARPGDDLLAAFCLEGRYTENTPFFSSLRDRAPAKLRDDGEALVEAAESGAAHAARDVSMPGIAGSLLQLLEVAGCGATLELEQHSPARRRLDRAVARDVPELRLPAGGASGRHRKRRRAVPQARACVRALRTARRQRRAAARCRRTHRSAVGPESRAANPHWCGPDRCAAHPARRRRIDMSW